MPWRIKRIWALTLLGVAALSLAVIVLVLNRDTSTDLLAVLGLIGGVAIIVTTLPVNGDGKP
jgi:peptidoglycan/LPS O-acetylase OafA/YrhL